MITEQEADIASAGMEVMVHAAERFVDVLVDYFEEKMKERQDYLELKKTVGKQAASEYVKKLNRRMITQDEKLRIGEWLQAARKLIILTERFTKVGMESKKHEDISDMEMFDSLLRDANRMCEIFLLYGNIPEENNLKMLSTMKLLGTRTDVPTEFINKHFHPKI